MNKSFKLILFIIPLLSSCNSKEIICHKICINDGSPVTLNNPIYKQDNVLFIDLVEMSPYLGGKATFAEGDYRVSAVEFNNMLITFSKDNDVATIAYVKAQHAIEYKLSAKVKGKDKGLDVPINDYVTMLDYTYKIDSDIYYMNKKAKI